MIEFMGSAEQILLMATGDEETGAVDVYTVMAAVQDCDPDTWDIRTWNSEDAVDGLRMNGLGYVLLRRHPKAWRGTQRLAAT